MSANHEIMGYEVLATLGYGARSTIFAVKDADHQVYALKRVVRQTAADQRFIDQAILEHEIASQFDHVALRRSYKLLKQRSMLRVSEVYTLMELIDGLTFEQHHPKSMLEFCRLSQQACRGLGAMHQKGYVHADIKPNNILITDEQLVKIIDFGQSCPVGTVKERIQGTPDYIAPEQVLRQEIVPQTDVFNFGATMYWMLTHRHVPTLIPKEQPGTPIKKQGKSNEAPPPIEMNSAVTPLLSQLVMHCVQPEPLRRPETMAEVVDRLESAIREIPDESTPLQLPRVASA